MRYMTFGERDRLLPGEQRQQHQSRHCGGDAERGGWRRWRDDHEKIQKQQQQQQQQQQQGDSNRRRTLLPEFCQATKKNPVVCGGLLIMSATTLLA
ncbi:unnamed protein product [Ectocarpus fasciculatus]